MLIWDGPAGGAPTGIGIGSVDPRDTDLSSVLKLLTLLLPVDMIPIRTSLPYGYEGLMIDDPRATFSITMANGGPIPKDLFIKRDANDEEPAVTIYEGYGLAGSIMFCIELLEGDATEERIEGLRSLGFIEPKPQGLGEQK
ncbi:MAG: hypothetical protein UZ21_OP11001001012 [Microgenomates bacterium OLB22]|nr:MAG: hypothetical protein UZ21_OP11001001012 [Microgenomates bacterium OLB22]